MDGEQRWEKKIEDGRERIREEEIVLKKLEEQLELRRDTLKESGKIWKNNRKFCNGNIMRRQKRKSDWRNMKKETRLRSICKYGKIS